MVFCSPAIALASCNNVQCSAGTCAGIISAAACGPGTCIGTDYLTCWGSCSCGAKIDGGAGGAKCVCT
jgi:hypothetical protein